MTDSIILNTSAEAATYRTDIKGWVSRDGRFYGDGPANERTARYAGCTHVACNACGAPTEKNWLRCASCRAADDTAKFYAMPEEVWDGKAQLYSEAVDRYFSSPDDAEDWLEDGQALGDLRLVICEPNYVPQLSDEYCADELPEDSDDLPDAVIQAMNAFNKAVAGIVLSWSPGKRRLKV